MAERRDYYFRQKVTEAELDAGFEGLEQADFNIVIDHDFTGINSGMVVTEKAGVPDLSVDVSSGISNSKQGEHIQFGSTQNVDVSQDDGGTPTTVTVPGNTRVVSVFVEFDRALSDPRIDGNSFTVYFIRAESFDFSVVQGAEAIIGSEIPPPLASTKLLLADIRLENGTTQVLNSHTVGAFDQIDTTRREDAFKYTGGTVEIEQGTAYDAIDDLLTALNNHITAVSNQHPASEITYNDTPTWLGGTTLDGVTVVDDVQEAIAAVMSDLARTASGDSGAHRIGKYLSPTWHDGSSLATGSIAAQIDEIITDLRATAGSGGGDLIGIAGQSSGGESVSNGSIYDQIGELLTSLLAKAPLATSNTFGGATNTFTNALTVNGQTTLNGDVAIDNTTEFTEVADSTEMLLPLITFTPPQYTVTDWGRLCIINCDSGYSGSQMNFKLYATSGSPAVGRESLEVAINCFWTGGSTGTWSQTDTNFDSILIRLSYAGIMYYHKVSGTGGNWTDSTWDETLFEIERNTYSSAEKAELGLEDGIIRFRNSTSAASAEITNPTQAVTPTANTIYAKNTCKAWACIQIDGSGNVTSIDGFNVITPSNPGASADFDFDFRSSLTTNEYAVVCCDLSGNNYNYVVSVKAVAGFDVRLFDADAGTVITHDTGSVHVVSVIVFGTDASS